MTEYLIDQVVPGGGDFRFIVATKNYENTVSFYRDRLGLPLYRAWDRPDGKGALFRAAAGTIEILDDAAGSPYVPYGGIGVGVEVENVDEWRRRLNGGDIEIVHDVLQEHGFRVCRFRDPAGVVVMPFSKIEQVRP